MMPIVKLLFWEQKRRWNTGAKVPCFLRGDDPDQVQRVSHSSDLSLRHFIFGTPTS